MTTINAYTVHAGNSIFKECTNVITADCNGVSWVNNSMYNAFYNCRNLTEITNISTGITDLTNTYRNCISLSTFPKIQNTTTTLYGTFYGCTSLKNVPSIPNSVINVDYTFANCTNLTAVPKLPNTITNLTSTFENCKNLIYTTGLPSSITMLTDSFRNCTNLNQEIVIPEAASTLMRTFEDCTSLTVMPTIPGSVQTLYQTFRNCTNLTTATNISANIVNIANAFQNCTNLTGNIYIYSNQITNAIDSFKNTSIIKNVYIPFKYTNSVNTKTYNAFISAGYKTDGSVCGVKLISMDLATFTINPTPSNAKVVLTADGAIQSGNSITVKKGTVVSWSVSLYGYVTQSSTRTVSSNYTQSVSLSKTNFTYTITPSPEDATVTLTAAGYTQSGNSITVPYETVVNWSVSKTNYTSLSGTKTITETSTEEKVLDLEFHTFTINPTPSDCFIQILATGYAQIGNSITVRYGTEITWTVSKDYYYEQTGTLTLTENKTIDVSLTAKYPKGTVIFESSTAGIYSITLEHTQNYTLYIVGAGGAGGTDRYNHLPRYYSSAGGGSGAYVTGTKLVNAGTYNIIVGAGGTNPGTAHQGTDSEDSSAFSEIAGAGKSGYAYTVTRTAGAGGTAITTLTGISGNAGGTGTSSASGGASVYGGYGVGASQKYDTASTGGNGYIKIVVA